MGLTWNLKEAELLLNQGLLAFQTNVVHFFFTSPMTRMLQDSQLELVFGF